MAEVRVTAEDVIAHVKATGDGQAETARKLGVSIGTVKSWVHRARATGALPPSQPQLKLRGHAAGVGKPAELHMLPAPKQELPPELKSQAQKAIERRLKRLAGPVEMESESPADSARILGALLDRFALFGELDKAAPTGETIPTPDTPEGEEALVAMAARLPAHVLERARQKQAG